MIDINTYARLGVKFYEKEKTEDPSVHFVMQLFNHRIAVAEQITQMHPNFETVLRMMKESNDDINNGRDYYQKLYEEFDNILNLYSSDNSLANDINFAVLFAAQGSFLDRSNEDREFSMQLIELVDNNSSEVLGVACFLLTSALWFSNFKDYQNLLTSALWFSNFKDYQNLVYQQINDVNKKETGNIINYAEKESLIDDFTNEALRDKESVKLDLDRMKDFISAYMEFCEKEPMIMDRTINARLVFIQSLLGTPDFAYKNANFVTANFFVSEFDKIVNQIENDKFGYVLAIVNCNLSGKALWEVAEDGAESVSGANWSSIFQHVEAVAKKMGWDGNYDE